MAPRGRPKKRANTRMDAAIDAMKPMGFPKNLIVKTVKELLKVYGGEDGWPFIEDSAYKVLIEAILEKVNGEETDDSKKPAAETSGGTHLEPACSSVNPSNTILQTSIDMDCASEANEASAGTLVPVFSSENPSNAALQASIEMDCTSEANEATAGTLEPVFFSMNPSNTALQISQDLDYPSEANLALCAAKPTNEYGSVRRQLEYPGSTSHFSPLPSHNPPMPDRDSTRRRRPCYGWACSDDEEDLVELRPGPLAQEVEKWLLSFREHKRKWDVRPGEM